MNTKTRKARKTNRFNRYNMGRDLLNAIDKTKPIIIDYASSGSGERCTYRLLDGDWNRNGISGRSFYSFRVSCITDYISGGKVTDEGRTYETLTIVYFPPEEYAFPVDGERFSEAVCAVTNDRNLQSNYRGDRMEELAKKLVRVLERARKAKV